MGPMLLLLAVMLAVLGGYSLRAQLKTWRRLRTETLPSDDQRYLRGVAQRRTIIAGLLFVLAALLAAGYLTGGVDELVRIAQLRQQDPPQDSTPEDRDTVKALAIYWSAVLVLLFFVITFAIVDSTATSLYGRQQLRRIQREQSDLLERDLAVYRQQKLNDRMRKDV